MNAAARAGLSTGLSTVKSILRRLRMIGAEPIPVLAKARSCDDDHFVLLAPTVVWLSHDDIEI
jgi:hypothetical protein